MSVAQDEAPRAGRGFYAQLQQGVLHAERPEGHGPLTLLLGAVVVLVVPDEAFQTLPGHADPEGPLLIQPGRSHEPFRRRARRQGEPSPDTAHERDRASLVAEP